MGPVDRWLIIEEGRNPSTDYFILPFLQKLGVSWERAGFNDYPLYENIKNTKFIFVRYIPRKWQSLIDKNGAKIPEVYFFIDDDLFDWQAFLTMPIRYQTKIIRYSWSKQSWLKSIGAKLLVSTPYLQGKYTDWNPELLHAKSLKIERDNSLSIFYHGSASHLDDIRWLKPIVSEVLKQNSRLTFEVIGGSGVNRLFNDIPRVQVLHPMKWPTYISLLKKPGRSIGLAPLLDKPFNRARSHTKFFDITQSGAVGIYAAGDIYGRIVRHLENGLLLPMKPSLWIDGILQLAEDEALRENLLVEAKKCL
ncbi:glycosyltransferase family 1 protein [Microbulbifer sp. SSSA002]|uniref:glycosyltransferase family 1 protein n=1 Tax=Microbulbifer sp. SSSA002 TaxID=3243376 RepID=UPI0040399936